MLKAIDGVGTGRIPIGSSLSAGIKSSLEGWVWTLAGGYDILPADSGRLELLGRARYFSLYTSTYGNQVLKKQF